MGPHVPTGIFCVSTSFSVSTLTQSFRLTFRVRVLNLGKNAGCFQLCFAVYSLLAAKGVSRKISSSKERREKAVLAG